MPWNGRWLLGAALVVALASVGFWAKTRLNGGEAPATSQTDDLVIEQELKGPVPPNYCPASPAMPACCPAPGEVVPARLEVPIAPAPSPLGAGNPPPDEPISENPLPPPISETP